MSLFGTTESEIDIDDSKKAASFYMDNFDSDVVFNLVVTRFCKLKEVIKIKL